MTVSYSNISATRKTVRLTRYDRRPHSFTGNAIVIIDEDGTKRLMSYYTEVARVDPDGSFHKSWDGYSVSTANHVRMFAREYAPKWLARLGMCADGVYRGTFKSNWIAMPLS